MLHVMAMLIPEAWSSNQNMNPDKKAFYEYHASLMEPWDGPAAIAFTDGRVIGATLDRNGLRPARYLVTHDGLAIMASETGVLPVKPEEVKMKGRLQPGKMFLVDTVEGRIVSDKEIKHRLYTRKPYAQWLHDNQVSIQSLPAPPRVHETDNETTPIRHRAFGYTDEDLRFIMLPMATTARSLWAQWGPTRRWPVFPTGRSLCSITSSSCSPKSLTRPSTRSAKRW